MIGNQTLGPSTFAQEDIVDPTFPTVASTTTISLSSRINRITGNVTVSTINQPNPYYNGPIYILNTDASVGAWDTGGNIALGGTFTRFKVFAFVFDTATSKWYPSATS